jgi:hypothetical protein
MGIHPGGLQFTLPKEQQIWLLTLYGKDEADDLTTDQKRALKTAIVEEKRVRAKKRNKK